VKPAQSTTGILTLSHGAGRCDLIPALGGSIAAWTVDGQEMMRSADAPSIAANDPFGMASFPLVPYSNRIGEGSFEWDGERFALARNFPPEPHAIHGVGFQRPWRVRARTADSATLAMSHRPGASWPFAFEAQQRIALGDGTLAIEMDVVNLADRAVPLAFGHHPYFPGGGAFLKFRAQSVWLVGDDGLPSLKVVPFGKFDYSSAMPVARGDIDHCFVGWDRMAGIFWPDRPLALEVTASEALSCAVVCIRSDIDGFCFEPVPHLNDAVNRRGGDYGMPVIAPGKSVTAGIRFRAVKREEAPGQFSGWRADRPNPGAPG
jgi:aldose 1-epimerase